MDNFPHNSWQGKVFFRNMKEKEPLYVCLGIDCEENHHRDFRITEIRYALEW